MVLAVGACQESPADVGVTGKVRIDGSSTVQPILAAAAELFSAVEPHVRVIVGVSGSGGGFKKFLEEKPALRTDINDSSRPIQPSEAIRAQKLGVEFIELPIGLDGIAILVNRRNDFCASLTLDELRSIWSPDSDITSWRQVRVGFPDVPLKLYGPGHDSGTFDYFTEVIVGKAKRCRSDYTASENDNVLVQGVAGDLGALGYMGFAYYEANADRLKLVAVDRGDGRPVKPDRTAIRTGGYAPLARPLFVYVSKAAAERDEVSRFVEFLLEKAAMIVEHPQVGYVALPAELYEVVRKRFVDRVAGTAFHDGEQAGRSLAERLERS